MTLTLGSRCVFYLGVKVVRHAIYIPGAKSTKSLIQHPLRTIEPWFKVMVREFLITLWKWNKNLLYVFYNIRGVEPITEAFIIAIIYFITSLLVLLPLTWTLLHVLDVQKTPCYHQNGYLYILDFCELHYTDLSFSSVRLWWLPF